MPLSAVFTLPWWCYLEAKWAIVLQVQEGENCAAETGAVGASGSPMSRRRTGAVSFPHNTDVSSPRRIAAVIFQIEAWWSQGHVFGNLINETEIFGFYIVKIDYLRKYPRPPISVLKTNVKERASCDQVDLQARLALFANAAPSHRHRVSRAARWIQFAQQESLRRVEVARERRWSHGIGHLVTQLPHGHRLPDDRCGLEGENSANYPRITHSVGMHWSGHKHILQRDGLIMGTHELQTLSEPWQKKDIDRKVFGQTNQNYQGWETVARKHIQLFIPHSKTAVDFHPVVHLASIWHLLCEELC